MTRSFTLDDLQRILVEAAGAADGLVLAGELADKGFEELGYESLALLETSSRIEREYGITLDDSALTDTATPRTLIEAVNSELSAPVS